MSEKDGTNAGREGGCDGRVRDEAASACEERLEALIRLPAWRRRDALPFASAYLALTFADHWFHSGAATSWDGANGNGDGGSVGLSSREGGVLAESTDAAMEFGGLLVDALFVSLLLSQLVLFLMARWDPVVEARLGYRRASATDVGGGDDDMGAWTHCLVVPAAPADHHHDEVGGGDKQSGRKKKTAVSQRGDRPGIVPLIVEEGGPAASGGDAFADEVSTRTAVVHFRGWTYRHCRRPRQPGSKSFREAAGDAEMEGLWRTSPLPSLENEGGVCEAPVDEGSGDGTSAPRFHRLHFPVDLPLSFYVRRWQGHDHRRGLLTLDAARRVYGSNTTPIPLPRFASLLGEQLLHPFFLFQLFCVLLWCLDEYWYYALFTLGSLIMFESTQAYSRLRAVKQLREEVGDQSSGGEGVWCHRAGEWTLAGDGELVAGDVVSLSSESSLRGRHGGHHERGRTVPADLLLVGRGRAVVNEAMLTGESVPQVKESIRSEEGGDDGGTRDSLDLSEGSTHRRSVLFGGTILVDHHADGADDDNGDNNDDGDSWDEIPSPPDGGVVCFVLRTGYDTTQGRLLRALAYAAESSGTSNHGGSEGIDSYETFAFVLVLLLCALVSATSVLYHGWDDVRRNRFKLCLHVVVIVTSVIPPELPMELSLAITTSLAELIKRYGIFCTEPFRIPLAGLVDTCCFDKTGTLTSDELRLHGVRLPFPGSSSVPGGVDNGGIGISASSIKGLKKSRHDGEDDHDLVLLDGIVGGSVTGGDLAASVSAAASTVRLSVPRETLRVMVGCQSLAATRRASRGRARTDVETELCGDPLEKAVLEGCGWTVRHGVVSGKNVTVVEEKGGGGTKGDGSIAILHRFPFSSKLRRMTVLAIDCDTDDVYALTKGAPEALTPLLDPTTLPPDYVAAYQAHMNMGRRVLALAYRNLGSNISDLKKSRENAERNLQYAGLLIMDCPLKADSAKIVRELRSSRHDVVMVTGDAVLTAAEVARRVGIIDAPPERTYELYELQTAAEGGRSSFAFAKLGRGAEGGTTETTAVADKDALPPLPYTPANVSKLAKLVRRGEVAVCVAGDVLTKVVVAAVRRVEGDAAANDSSKAKKKSVDDDDRSALFHPAARAELSALVPIVSVFARHAPSHKEAIIRALNSIGRHTLMCGDGTNDVGALKQAHVGVSIVSVPDLEAKQRTAKRTIATVKAEEKRERRAAKAKKQPSSAGGNDRSATKRSAKPSRVARLERSLKELNEEELAHVGLGNASMASPFTSRNTSISCCRDVLLVGRCTLVTMIQIYKILGVNCLVNALVLTKLHMHGAKQGDRQLTAVGLVVAGLFLFVTRGKPLSKLSKTRPPHSVLSAETMLSIALQFFVHFIAIVAATIASDAYVDPYDPSIVPDGPFHPNTLNTATFLVTVLANINTFAVNYRGRPFMEDLNENALLLRSLQACYFILFVCASDAFPPLNQLLQLSPLPMSGRPQFSFDPNGSDGGSTSEVVESLLQIVDKVGFRAALCVIMCLDSLLVFGLEKLIRKN